ncbi:MAG: hypothetical protein EON96_11450, partial [Caulobacteraceae bacterium]
GDVQIDPARLAMRAVDTGPEDVAALALNGGGDPGLARRRGGPDEAAIPRRAGRYARLTGIGDAQGDGPSGGQGLGQLHRQPALGIGPAVDGDLDAIDLNRRDGQQRIQIDDQGLQRRLGGEIQHGDRVDGLVGRHDLDRQVGLVEPHGLLLDGQRLVGGQGVGGGFTRGRGCRCRGGGAGGQGQKARGGEQNRHAHRTSLSSGWEGLARPG